MLSGLPGRKDEHPTETTRDAQIKTLPRVVIWRMVLVLALESASASTNQGQSTVQGRCFLGPSACTSARTRAGGRRHQIQSCSVDRGWRPTGSLFLSSSSSGVHGRTNVVLAQRWRGLDLSTSGPVTPKTQFRGSCRTALTIRGRFRGTDGRGIQR